MTWKSFPDHAEFVRAVEVAAAKYEANGLAYHNLEHIQGMLRCLQDWSIPDLDIETRAALELAIVYHDVVYIPGHLDNESASAQEAMEALGPIDGTEAILPIIESAILSTATHTNPSGGLLNDLIIDLDLVGIGTDSYWQNGAKIRSEFKSFSDEEYAQGRRKFLAVYGSRDPLFHTSYGRQYEAKARENMEEELRILESSAFPSYQ